MRSDKHYPGIFSTRVYQNVAQKLDAEQSLHARKHTYLLLVNIKHSSKLDVVKLVTVKHKQTNDQYIQTTTCIVLTVRCGHRHQRHIGDWVFNHTKYIYIFYIAH